MTAPLQPVGAGSLLYVPVDRPANGAITGFLFPAGAAPPATISIADALAAQGWFVIAGALADSAVPAFVAAAQTWFAASARNGAVLSWFTNAASPGGGLAGWTIFAGPGGSRSALTTTASIQFGNFAIGLPRGTGLAASADGTALRFTAATSPVTLAVTPFGARTPVTFPTTGPLLVDLAGDPAGAGCTTFGFSADVAGLDALDVGLRSYSAPLAGGYAQTARHRPFDFSQGKITLAAMLDPLLPTDHDRSRLVPASGLTVPSFYRSAAGPAWQASFGADFAFVLATRLVGVDAKGDPVPVGNPVYTIVPSGAVDLTLPTSTDLGAAASSLAPTLMGGLSSVEYFSAPSAVALVFAPDQPAFAPTVQANGADGQGRSFGALTNAATTAWASIVAPGAGTAYYSQPDQAVLHQGDSGGSNFLSYLPQQISALPAGASAPVPLLPYGSVVAGPGFSLDDLGQFERQAWSPKRLATLQPAPSGSAAMLASGAPQPPPGNAPDPPFGTTKQGLLLQFDGEGSWADLTLAMSSPPPDTPRKPGPILTTVAGKLRAALQTNELFLVVSAGDLLLADSDMAYELSTERVDLINTKIGDAACRTWLSSLVANGAISCAGLAALTTKVLTGAPSGMSDYIDIVRNYAADFSLFAAGAAGADAWEFDLSPWRWPEHQTILIFKFCNKKLSQAIVDPSQWGAPDDFNANAAATAQQVGQIISDARQRRTTDADLAYFVDTVLDDPTWNGIIALNALVPLAGLPEQMRALAAGIDPSQFAAHHVGVSVTPVTPGATTFSAAPSSIFGLIDYEDPTPLQSGDAFAFKVNTLKVLIANSQVAGFSSHVELLINQLFGEPATQIGAPDNNLGFDGYYQKTADTTGSGTEVGTYRFVTPGPTAYTMSSRVLDQVAITGATFVTLPGTTDQNPIVNAAFQLNGAIAFLPQPGFDLFSYGPEQVTTTIEQGLTYRSLAVDMSFNEATPSYRTFAFDAAKLVVDPTTSLARAASLVSHFPMKLTTLVQGSGSTTPDSLGFMPVDMPIQGSSLSAPWFGLRFDLDLGTPGALAAATGFNAGLLLAWAPNPSGATVYCGLSLPGVSGGQRAISLEGVISLVFGGISFVVAPPTYLIQLSNIALKILSVSFPPNGQVNMTLFGNPQQQTSGALGWFAAYIKNGAGGGGNQQQKRIAQHPALPGAR